MTGLSEARLEVERASVQDMQGCRGGISRVSDSSWGEMGRNLNAAGPGSRERFLQNQGSSWVKPAVEPMHYSERGELY